MYLNLDLLYNTYKYLYPLFYYGVNYIKNVYCPITKKSITKGVLFNFVAYFDYITKNLEYNNEKSCFTEYFTEYYSNRIFTENIIIRNGYIYNKCNPVKLTKKELHFLKSNTRIKL